jgi:hypothetical protein
MIISIFCKGTHFPALRWSKRRFFCISARLALTLRKLIIQDDETDSIICDDICLADGV